MQLTRESTRIPTLDRTIHEPARLAIVTVLMGADQVDFNYLLTVLGLSRGNLSSHMLRLQQAGYVTVSKQFIGNSPNTSYALTDLGRAALRTYWAQLDDLRLAARSATPPKQQASAVARARSRRREHGAVGVT